MTTAVFLSGPLAWRPLFTSITDEDVGPCALASLADHAVIAAPQDVFPALCGQAGAHAQGILLSAPSEDTRTRLAFFAQGLGVEPRKVTLVSGQEALTFVGAAEAHGTPWDETRWQGSFGDLALGACREAMGYFGRISPEGLAWRMQMILSRAAARQAAKVGKPADMRCATTAADVTCIDRKTPHEGYFLTREYELSYPGFDGAPGPQVNREVFVATDAAIVLPYDSVRDRVLLVEQFRMGPYGRGDPRPWMLEPVAGRVDAGETPEETAHRECAEEAGLQLRSLELISRHYCTPGTSSEYFHLYLGLCDLPRLGHGLGGLDSEHEDIRTHVISYASAIELLETGEADNGPLVLSLIWLSRERDRLRSAP